MIASWLKALRSKFGPSKCTVELLMIVGRQLDAARRWRDLSERSYWDELVSILNSGLTGASPVSENHPMSHTILVRLFKLYVSLTCSIEGFADCIAVDEEWPFPNGMMQLVKTYARNRKYLTAAALISPPSSEYIRTNAGSARAGTVTGGNSPYHHLLPPVQSKTTTNVHGHRTELSISVVER